MGYSHCTGLGLGQVQGTGKGLMDPNTLCRNVHTGQRQGKELGHIVFYCTGPVTATCPGLLPAQCE